MKDSSIVIGGGLALLALWWFTGRGDSVMSGGGGSSNEGSGGGVTDYLIDSGKTWRPSTISDGLTQTSDTKVYTKNTVKTWKKKTDPSMGNGWVFAGPPQTNEPSGLGSPMSGITRTVMGVVTGGGSEMARMAQEGISEGLTLPWWSSIFPPITTPIAMAVTTHNADTATPNESARRFSGLIPTLLSNRPDQQLPQTSRSAELAQQGVKTPRVALAMGELSAAALENYPMLTGVTGLTPNTIRLAESGGLRQSTAQSIADYFAVKRGDMSAYEYAGGDRANWVGPITKEGYDYTFNAFARSRGYQPRTQTSRIQTNVAGGNNSTTTLVTPSQRQSRSGVKTQVRTPVIRKPVKGLIKIKKKR